MDEMTKKVFFSKTEWKSENRQRERDMRELKRKILH